MLATTTWGELSKVEVHRNNLQFYQNEKTSTEDVETLAEELQPLYKEWGIDFQATYGNATFELPMPATYVVDQDSRIILSFVDSDYTKRMEPSAVLDALKEIAVWFCISWAFGSMFYEMWNQTMNQGLGISAKWFSSS